MNISKGNRKKFYITTPIYYANALPHIGNAYTSLVADIFARTKRMLGYDVKFATGTDENGQKMVQTAAAAGKDVMNFLDEVAAGHKATRDELKISYTDFIRTTESRHKEFVQEMIRKTFAAGDIYKGTYTGYYCVGCEAFKKPADLTEEGLCPDHLKKPEVIEEQNRFFRLSKYQNRLTELYQTNPEFCLPGFRYNEVKSFVEQGLEDFSISRQGSEFGIHFPEDIDPEAVVYIRFDALYNYLTVCQPTTQSTAQIASQTDVQTDMLSDEDSFRTEDTEKVHAIGKDIARFHAIYRPAMLQASGNLTPDHVIINGFFTVNGQKMSKSLGNTIMPLEMTQEYGRDALVYYLFSDIKIGSDGDFSIDRFHAMRENVLKKGRGNLVSRVVTLAQKYEVHNIQISEHMLQLFSTVFDDIHQEGTEKNTCYEVIMGTCNFSELNSYLQDVDPACYLRDWFQLVQAGNKFIDEYKPREVAKVDTQLAQEYLGVLVWLIKNCAVLASPYLIEGMQKVQNILQIDHQHWASFTTADTHAGHAEELIGLQAFIVSYQPEHLY